MYLEHRGLVQEQSSNGPWNEATPIHIPRPKNVGESANHHRDAIAVIIRLGQDIPADFRSIIGMSAQQCHLLHIGEGWTISVHLSLEATITRLTREACDPTRLQQVIGASNIHLEGLAGRVERLSLDRNRRQMDNGINAK